MRFIRAFNYDNDKRQCNEQKNLELAVKNRPLSNIHHSSFSMSAIPPFAVIPSLLVAEFYDHPTSDDRNQTASKIFAEFSSANSRVAGIVQT